MSLIQSLYFIALLPHQQLAERLTVIKHDFARNYGSSAALKTMPHITLQSPFKRSPEAEVEMHLRLQEFLRSMLHLKFRWMVLIVLTTQPKK